MKQCTRCKQWKEDEEFSFHDKAKGIRQYMCKACHREMNQARYERKKEQIQRVNKASNVRRVEEAQRYIYEVLSYSTCVDCGEYDFTVLTFHHVRGIKKMNVADMATRGYSLDAIKDEISKCIILCFSCHMRREFDGRGGRFRKFWPRMPWEK